MAETPGSETEVNQAQNAATQIHDEFENPPAGPIGLHRGQRSLLARTLPFLITIIVAVALAMGTWLWMSGKGRELFGNNPSSSQSTSTTETKKKSETTKKPDTATGSSSNNDSNTSTSPSTPNNSTTTNPNPTTTPTTPDMSKSVTVFNGLSTRVPGFAAGKARILSDAGYVSVSAKNADSKPAANVVWYKTDADKVTAQDIAGKLGISSVEQSSTIPTDVAVVFVTQ